MTSAILVQCLNFRSEIFSGFNFTGGGSRKFRKRRPKLNKIETWLYNYNNTQRTMRRVGVVQNVLKIQEKKGAVMINHIVISFKQMKFLVFFTLFGYSTNSQSGQLELTKWPARRAVFAFDKNCHITTWPRSKCSLFKK